MAFNNHLYVNQMASSMISPAVDNSDRRSLISSALMNEWASRSLVLQAALEQDLLASVGGHFHLRGDPLGLDQTTPFYRGIEINNVGPEASSSSNNKTPQEQAKHLHSDNHVCPNKCLSTDDGTIGNDSDLKPKTKPSIEAKRSAPYQSRCTTAKKKKEIPPPRPASPPPPPPRARTKVNHPKEEENKMKQATVSASKVDDARATTTGTTATLPLESTSRLNFPRILMKILSDTINGDSIEWLPNGKSFIIRSKQSLCSQVLPRYFTNCRLPTFARKLNRWGFKFHRDTGSYSHPHFQRDEPNLVQQMYTYEGKVRLMKETKINFPRIFHQLLEDESTCRGVVEWTPDGKSFLLLNPPVFQQIVLPKFFGARCKLKSFFRKISRWGFRRDQSNGAYSHPHFLRDYPQLIEKMYANEGAKMRQEERATQEENHF